MQGRTLIRLAGILFFSGIAVPASAQNVRSWVASSGNDGAACTRSAPCATFNRAITQTIDAGGISCVDSGNFITTGGLTITKSINIDCSEVNATAETGQTTGGIIINIPSSTTTCSRVTLTGILLNGRVDATTRADGKGVWIQAACQVVIDRMTITYFGQQGILDSRSAAEQYNNLQILNSTVRHTGGPAIVLANTAMHAAYNVSGGFTVIDNVNTSHNTYGLALAANNRATVNNSRFTNTTNAAVHADGGAFLRIDNSVIAMNGGTGINAYGSVLLSNSASWNNGIQYNGTGLLSYGNNRFDGNPLPSPSTIPLK